MIVAGDKVRVKDVFADGEHAQLFIGKTGRVIKVWRNGIAYVLFDEKVIQDENHSYEYTYRHINDLEKIKGGKSD